VSRYSDITLHHFEAILDFREDLTMKEIRKLIADTIVKKMTDVEKERATNKRERKGEEAPPPTAVNMSGIRDTKPSGLQPLRNTREGRA